MTEKNFILASGSVPRRQLLEQIGYTPKLVDPADIDETTGKYETPTAYVKRMAVEKASAVAEYEITQLLVMATSALREAPNGNKVIHKSRTPEEQTEVMKQLSGKAHRVISAVCVIGSDGRRALRCVPTRVLMKKLTPAEIQAYVDGKEWVGCCGYKIEGELAGYVKKIIGSYSGVVGLPLFETKNLLNGAGVK